MGELGNYQHKREQGNAQAQPESAEVPPVVNPQEETKDMDLVQGAVEDDEDLRRMAKQRLRTSNQRQRLRRRRRKRRAARKRRRRKRRKTRRGGTDSSKLEIPIEKFLRSRTGLMQATLIKYQTHWR